MKTDDAPATAVASPTSLVHAPHNGAVADYKPIRGDAEMVNLVKRAVAKDATDTELALFINQCDRTRLDPISKQIYFIKDKRGRVNITTSIDGFRIIAQRGGQYAGQDGPFWCGADGEWKDVWLSKEKPSAARVVVHKIINGQFCMVSAVAHFSEYNGDNYMWNKMPSTMLAKCAEALALRKAFPNDLSGIYTFDEMDQSGMERPSTTSASQPASSAGSALGAKGLAERLAGSENDGDVIDAEYSVVDDKPAEEPQPPKEEEKKIELPKLTIKNLVEVLRSKRAEVTGQDNTVQEVDFSDTLIQSRVANYNHLNFKKEKWADLTESEKKKLMTDAVLGKLNKSEADIPF